MILMKRESKTWSAVWSNFMEIREQSDLHKQTNFVRCTNCFEVIYKPSSNTNKLLRHRCKNGVSSTRTVIKPEDKLRLKLGAANFVAKDLRPYFAVECTGLMDLCTSCMEFGQLYRKANRVDLEKAMPSRNTVKATVKYIAGKKREQAKELLKKAIETGGIAATTDTWKDDFRKATYISVVAHLTIDEDKICQHKRIVMACSEITEMVKRGTTIRI